MIREQLRDMVPPRFLRTNIFRYLYAHALLADATLEAVLQAVSARFPGFGTETALSRISHDRGIRRGFAEDATDFAKRARLFLDAHKKQGSVWELMRQVQGYCAPKHPRIRHVFPIASANKVVWRTLESDGTRTTVVTTPANFDWDGLSGPLWSRGWLIIYSTGGEAPWVSDGTWDDTASASWDADLALTRTWGSTANLAEVTAVRDIVKDWKSGATVYPSVIISFDDSLFDPAGSSPPNPDGTWLYDGAIVGGAEVIARASAATYWHSVA